MKIALVSRGYGLSYGGAEAVTVQLSRVLHRGGHNVTVYAEKVDPSLDLGKVEVKTVSINRKFSLFRGWSFHRKISKVLKGKDHDVVFGFCPFYPVDVYRASGGVHGHWMRLRYPEKFKRFVKYLTSPANWVTDKLEKNMFKAGRCKFVITNSILAKEHFKKYFGLPDEQVRVVYNGVDHNVFNSGLKKHRVTVREELGISDKETVALYISNNWKRKGLESVIKAMEGFKDITLIVIGRGNEADFKSVIDESKVDVKKIKFLGIRRDVEKFYGASDFFVLPTRYDPCANVCLEAMASGLPVITTMENGAAEFVVHDYNGFIIEDWRDVMLMGQYFYTLTDRHVSESMGSRAENAMKPYSWEKTMNETLEVCNLAKAKKQDGK